MIIRIGSRSNLTVATETRKIEDAHGSKRIVFKGQEVPSGLASRYWTAVNDKLEKAAK